MAEAQFIEDVEELDDELPKLSQSAAWIVVDPQSLSAAQFALNSNLSAIADRQDAYYREVLKKFLDYPKTSGSDISADALPTPAPTKKGMKAPVNPGSDFEQQALANWDVLSNLLQEFEKSGQPLVLHYGSEFNPFLPNSSYLTDRIAISRGQLSCRSQILVLLHGACVSRGRTRER